MAERQGAGDTALAAIAQGRHGDPFAVLGPHAEGGRTVVRAFLPHARGLDIVDAAGDEPDIRAERIDDAGLFVARLPCARPYRLRIAWPDETQETEDPYAFPPLLGELDLHLIAEGRHRRLADALGAHPLELDGVPGVRFATWAPNARRVSVVGDFNAWDGRRHPMRRRGDSGVWEIFVPRLGAGERYKYEILGPDGEVLPLKADPCGRQHEREPGTASIVAASDRFEWHDAAWLATRANRQSAAAPISIYEVHAASWMHDADGKPLRWAELAERLIPYATGMGFTHVEFLPLSEHPFGGSWGYQPVGLFAPTARHGTPQEFARFVDACHEAGLGVIVDWVPAHFPTDPHGLARYDGTALYEHADPREGFHRDWNSLIYNFGRHEVRGFLIASALEWLERYHVDGLRVDAVASMLYRDYSRGPGEWIPNVHGGRENYEAEAFLRELNVVVHERCRGAIVVAEESTAWPGVTHPATRGGLGFSFKWNMGWMHDTLRYVAREPVHRRHHHHDLTFGLLYAFTERFVLAISHDEVVHGKRSLLGRMPGDRWQRFANLRAYLGFMWTHPGKKLLFMGCELAQETEWNHDAALPWHLLDDPLHRGVQRVVRDLNRSYAGEAALHARDADPGGFRWLVPDDDVQSVLAFTRCGRTGDRPVVVVANFTPQPRQGYRIGVPSAGRWRELVNTDACEYGGGGAGNLGAIDSCPVPAHGEAQSLLLTLPPLATIVLRSDGAA